MIAYSVLNAFIVALAFCGNLLVLVVVVLNKDFHVMRYFYLVSLAFSDFLFATAVLSFRVVAAAREKWLFGTPWCYASAYIALVLHLSSVLHLCAVSYERYRAIVKDHLIYDGYITPGKVIVAVLVLWFVPVVIPIVPFLGWGAYEYHPKLFVCGLKLADKATVLLMVIYFHAPFVVLSVFNYKLLMVARSVQLQIMPHFARESATSYKRREPLEAQGRNVRHVQAPAQHETTNQQNEYQTELVSQPSTSQEEFHFGVEEVFPERNRYDTSTEQVPNGPIPRAQELKSSPQGYMEQEHVERETRGGISGLKRGSGQDTVQCQQRKDQETNHINVVPVKVEVHCQQKDLDENLRDWQALRNENRLEDEVHDGSQLSGQSEITSGEQLKCHLKQRATSRSLNQLHFFNNCQIPDLIRLRISNRVRVTPTNECHINRDDRQSTDSPSLELAQIQERNSTPTTLANHREEASQGKDQKSLNDSVQREYLRGFVTTLKDFKTAKDVALIMGTFALCHLPLRIISLYQIIEEEPPAEVLLAVHSLYATSAIWNPIIYSIRKREFRKAVRKMFQC